MKTKELKKKFLDFFREKEHAIIPSAPLIPENDPTVLFTTAGMHPLIPFLMGSPHPLGKRIASTQKCIRTQDIDEVGDETHTTFFEMLGNWSLGDYFKKEAIEWSYEFLTGKRWLALDKERLAFTCFKGDSDAPKDTEAEEIWKSLGVPKERIAFLPKKENWWGPAGAIGPCGPDTEMFYWKDNQKEAPKVFDPHDENWVEIWNDVFMQYNKTAKGYEPLRQKNVDTGLGVERVAMVLQGKKDIFEVEVFTPIIEKIKELTEKDLSEKNKVSFRIIADHIKAATFILGDERGVPPSNVDQGYILRRYIRRSIRHLRLLGADTTNTQKTSELAQEVITIYKEEYPLLKEKEAFILDELRKEEEKFQKTLDKGIKEFEKIAGENKKEISAKDAFLLYQSYGFPIEMIEELAAEKKVNVDKKGFEKEYQKHQDLSRTGAEQKFKGGLSDQKVETVKLHTATHLLGEAIRKVLNDPNIKQRGSNITPQRLRYDFNFDRKLTDEEKKAIEDEVNKVIEADLKITVDEMPLKEALDSGAQAEFGTRYPEKVTVYSIGDYSKEICMGPHVKHTKELGRFRIKKEESSAAGVRRIKAVVS